MIQDLAYIIICVYGITYPLFKASEKIIEGFQRKHQKDTLMLPQERVIGPKDISKEQKRIEQEKKNYDDAVKLLYDDNVNVYERITRLKKLMKK